MTILPWVTGAEITNLKYNYNYKKCRSNLNTPVVFLTMQSCDSKEPKKIAVFYARWGKTKLSNTQRKRKISLTIVAFNNLLFFSSQDAVSCFCNPSTETHEQSRAKESQRETTILQGLYLHYAERKTEAIFYFIIFNQIFNTWLQRFPSSFSFRSLITFLNRFTCFPSIVVSSISFRTSNDCMNMLNWESDGIMELLWLCSMQL